jgi:uncharacterized membrane protein YhaH (DUF805 family)
MMNLLFSFQGRINRAKFWMVHVGILVVEIVVVLLLGGGAVLATGDYEQAMVMFTGAGGIVWLILMVVVLWISLAIGVKRWHDRNKSGWWILIILVPIVGPLWFLIECGFLKGTAGPNTYGPDPLLAG